MFKRGDIIYAQLKNPETGLYSTAKSTGQAEHDDALLVIAGWLKEELPQGRTGKTRPAKESFQIDAILQIIRNPCFASTDALRVLKAIEERGFTGPVSLKLALAQCPP